MGDPHFHAAHGDTFDFRGRDKAMYALLSAANIQFNALFQDADYHEAGSKHRLVHGSFMTAGYAKVLADDGRELTIEYDARRAVFIKVAVGSNSAVQYQAPISLSVGNVTVSLDGRQAQIASKEYVVTMKSKMKNGIANGARCADGKCFLEASIKPLIDADHAKVAPHGLLGQAWDGDDFAVIGNVDEYKGAEITTKAMGEGAIEGVAADYEVASKFATTFKFSRWGMQAAKPRDVSKLTGKKVPRTNVQVPTMTVEEPEEPEE